MSYLATIRQLYPAAIRTDGRPGVFSDALRDLEQCVDAGAGSGGDVEKDGSALSDLRRLGLIDVPVADASADAASDPFSPVGGPDGLPSIRPCIGLMDRLEMDLVPIAADDCPVRFCSGFVTLADLPFASGLEGRLICVGQGVTQAAASLACLGELAERLSVLSRGEGDDLISDSPAGGSRADRISAGAVLSYSAAQQADLMRDYPDLRADNDGAIAWETLSGRCMRVTALDGETRALAPSLVCLLREGRFYGVAGAPVTSTNGAASWWTLDGARQRAVMELIERDTVACWWANRLTPPRLELGVVRDLLPAELADWLAERARQTHFLRLSNDLGCPVFAAISQDAAGKCLAYGFKAALASADAVTGATLEMVQMEMHLQTVSDNLPRGAGGDFAHPLMQLSQTVDVARLPWLCGVPDRGPVRTEASWPGLVAQLVERSIPVWTFDATRADIGVPTVKAISPVLRDWSSRFGPGRLYDLPVQLGLRDCPLDEAELNPLRFVS